MVSDVGWCCLLGLVVCLTGVSGWCVRLLCLAGVSGTLDHREKRVR